MCRVRKVSYRKLVGESPEVPMEVQGVIRGLLRRRAAT